jgi:hypothetical protein
MSILAVDDRIGYGYEDDTVGLVRGYKKLTFWKALPGVTREVWEPLYAHHIVTVRDNQPQWRYRQNMITECPPGFPYDAISENWWANIHDITDGYYYSPEKKITLFEEIGQFIDVAETANFVCRNTVLSVG